MKESLKSKLVNFIKAQGGKHIPHWQLEMQTKNWGYRASNMERRLRECPEIGKVYNDGVIKFYYYLQPSQGAKPLATKEFCCGDQIKGLQTHSKDCLKKNSQGQFLIKGLF